MENFYIFERELVSVAVNRISAPEVRGSSELLEIEPRRDGLTMKVAW
jgi:hypothetical protein